MNGQTIRTITIRGTSEGLDKLTGDLNKLAAAEQNVAVVSEQSAKRVLSLEDAWKRQTLKLDDAARAQANIARETRVADAALREGLATQQQHAQRIEQINQRYATVTQSTQKFTTQTGLARHELINLGRQAQDVAVSLAGGQGFGTVMLQQGSQIADVFVSSGKSVGSFFSQAIGWGARFATSAAGVATGIAAIAAGGLLLASNWQEGQREIDRALLGIGARAGTTRGQINQMAQDNAAGAKLSVSEWASAAAEFARTGNIAKENFKGLGDLVKGFAATTGDSADEAAKKLAKMFGGDAMQAADGLNAIYGSISGKTREYAQDLDVAGKRQQAFALLIREATSGIQQATQVTGFWAASWDAVANAASNAGGAISRTLSAMTGVGDTPEAQLQRLQVQLANAEKALAQLREEAAQLGPELVPGLKIAEQGTASLRERVAALQQQLGKVDESNALLKMGRDADDATKKLLPQIDQLRQVEELQRKIREGQTPGSGAGLGAFSQQAFNAAAVLKDKIQQTADETARANANGLQLKETYGTTTVEAARTLDALKNQANVAGAVGGAAKMAAQEQARYNELIRQGVDAQDAAKIATAERAVTQAQINAQGKEMLFTLQNQAAASAAVTGNERIKAQAAATYNQLIHDGVSASIAAAVAAQQEANARAQVTAQVKEQVFQLEQSTELIKARVNGTEALVRAEHAYINAIRAGADSGAARELANATYENVKAQEAAAEAAKEAARALAEEKLVINSAADAWKAYNEGIVSWSRASDLANDAINSVSATLDRNAASAQAAAEATARYFAEYEKAKFIPFMTLDAMGGFGGLYQSNQGGYSQFNPAGYTSTIAPPPLPYPEQLLQNLNRAISGGGFSSAAQGVSAGSAISSLISSGFMTGTSERWESPIFDTAKLDLINRGIAALPKEQQTAPLQQLLKQLQATPPSLETVEAINSLNDRLEQLTSATEANTSATQTMTDVLSPFYSSDPRRTHLGFRAFAGGGIMTQYGELPLRQYQGGGMATSPQVAVYGEGSTPEAFVPVPSGRIPVEIKQPANSNRRPIQVTINVQGNADAGTVAALKSTAFQQAQAMRRVMG